MPTLTTFKCKFIFSCFYRAKKDALCGDQVPLPVHLWPCISHSIICRFLMEFVLSIHYRKLPVKYGFHEYGISDSYSYFRVWMNFYPYFIYFLINLGEIGWRKSLCNAGDHLRVLWKSVQWKPCFTYGHKLNVFHIFCISRLVWMKFSTGDIQKNLIGDHEFHKNPQSESHALLFYSFGMCIMERFLAVCRSFFLSTLLHTFSTHPSPSTILPSSLT